MYTGAQGDAVMSSIMLVILSRDAGPLAGSAVFGLWQLARDFRSAGDPLQRDALVNGVRSHCRKP